MAEPIRVLMITCAYPTDAHPRIVPFIVRQVEYLRKAGVDVDLFHFEGRKRLVNYMQAWRRLRAHTAGKQYDLVHAQWGQSAVLALPKRLPWVITFRGNDLEGIVGEGGRYTLRGRIQQAVSMAMGRMADQAIVVSERLGKKLKRNDFHVIPSGLDLELFRPMPMSETRRSLNFPPEKRLVLFAASRKANPRKRYELAEQAVNILRKRYDVELIVATKVSQSSIPVYMNACDALLLTSVHEGSPNVVKEALACNLAVVSTDVGDVRRRIGDIDGCFVCEDDSAETIASALERVLERTERIDGRSSVVDLDERLTTQRVIEAYRRAMQPSAQEAMTPAAKSTSEINSGSV